MRLVVAVDKFRGTATQAEIADVVVDVARQHDVDAVSFPMADGGEGLLEVFGGANRITTVTGPLGTPIEAGWTLDGDFAVIECAQASGLLVAGGHAGNDPWAATSRGTGELVLAARSAGATRILVGLGGSACTDGGRGAVGVLTPALVDDPRLMASITVCVDVTTHYLEAAKVFAPQKGADLATVRRLTERLHRERDRLIADFAFDPEPLDGSGAAGGLGGALAAMGARLVPGFGHIARVTGLPDQIAGSDLVVTGEGRLDATSLHGKVVGGVAALARAAGVDVMAVVGDMDPDLAVDFPVVSLTDRFGRDRAMNETLDCVRDVVTELISADDVVGG